LKATGIRQTVQWRPLLQRGRVIVDGCLVFAFILLVGDDETEEGLSPPATAN
jgi:hypothetical protein